MTRFIGLVLVLGIAGAAVAAPRPPALVIYNRSPSAPVGFYLRDDAQPSLGSFVTVSAPAVAPAYARMRGYDDRTDRFIKRVAAMGGDRVCARGGRVEIGRNIVLARRQSDSFGHALPAWSECRVLRRGELFLVGDTDNSFDARYWGPVRTDEIDGVWRHIGSAPRQHLNRLSSGSGLSPRDMPT
jgi:conjugative transfer signal peptidase TraF